ncbi:MAG: hypothetical protein MUP11_08865 [Anaerolineales bacterium]|nr:hypothetical protein [Anaerolineales bacterium]
MIFINEHKVRLDDQERLLPWASYDQIVWLAMDFIRRCPVDPRTGLPWYLAYSCFWTDPLRPAIWPDNPAGKFAMAVNTLVRYYAYSGEEWFTEVVRTMLDRLIAYQTPSTAAWPRVPYASAEPVFGNYFGARADGHYVTEPDKIAQAACGYVSFYKLTGDQSYLDQACHWADVLAEKIRKASENISPWPFRVDVRDGAVVEEYTSHVIPAIHLFDELIKLELDPDRKYQATREITWEWLLEYPVQNQRWKGYFEDIRLDPDNENREQYSALETARYLLLNPDHDPDWKSHARDIIEWVRTTFGADPFYKAVPIHEQKFCFHVMGSHTARYASLCALYASCTGEKEYAERAIRAFNWSTFMADENGWVRVGIDEPDYHNQCWFTDGYFDYVPHFLEGMALLPQTAPASEDHLLKSSSIIQKISYNPLHIKYRTFDSSAEELISLTFTPTSIICCGEQLIQVADPSAAVGWSYDPGQRLLRVSHTASEVELMGN